MAEWPVLVMDSGFIRYEVFGHVTIFTRTNHIEPRDHLLTLGVF